MTAPGTKPCASRTVVERLRSYSAKARDFPFGKNAAEVERDAARVAETKVQRLLKEEIRREIDGMACTAPCRKSIASFEVVLIAPLRVGFSPGRVWDTYTVTATAKGTAVVECHG